MIYLARHVGATSRKSNLILKYDGVASIFGGVYLAAVEVGRGGPRMGEAVGGCQGWPRPEGQGQGQGRTLELSRVRALKPLWAHRPDRRGSPLTQCVKPKLHDVSV